MKITNSAHPRSAAWEAASGAPAGATRSPGGVASGPGGYREGVKPAPTSTGEAARWCAVLTAWAFAAMALLRLPVRVGQPPFDFAPLYLGAHALHRGFDPGERTVHAALWRELGSGVAPGQWFNPYPATASLLAGPLARGWAWAEVGEPLRAGMVACVVATAALLLLLPGPSRSAKLAAAGLAAFAAAKLDALTHGLVLGQVNPLVVFLSVLAGVALVCGRDGLAGAAVAVGVGLKGFPLLLIPAAVRRPRVLAVFAGVALLLAAGVWWHVPGWNPLDDVDRARTQLTVGQWTPHPPFGGLWRLRTPVAAVVLGVPLLALIRRPQTPAVRAAAVGLCLGFGGVVAGGLAPPHEAALLLPAMVFHIGWLATDGWRALPSVAAVVLALAPATALDDYPSHDMRSQDHAAWLIALVAAAASARAVTVLRETRGLR